MTTRTPIVLITGACGEVGHGLIDFFAARDHLPAIVTLDLNPLHDDFLPLVKEHVQGNILDDALLAQLAERYVIDTIFHLAALLSTTSERRPTLAHDVNVNGTLKLLELATRESQALEQPVKFIYPSSVAAYGMPDLATKDALDAVPEDHYLQPITMYGVNKLYCENLGRYYDQHYQQLDDTCPRGIDFRCVRFPGLISAETVPSGGTSDYGPEMIHAAAQGKAYDCFVRPDTVIPFMAMPDAIKALIDLSQAPRQQLTRQVYNVTSFSLSAADFEQLVRAEFPAAQIDYAPHAGRQGIVDSWVAIMDDAAARRDWGWSPQYDQAATFRSYLFPTIRQRYTQKP